MKLRRYVLVCHYFACAAFVVAVCGLSGCKDVEEPAAQAPQTTENSTDEITENAASEESSTENRFRIIVAIAGAAIVLASLLAGALTISRRGSADAK